MMFAKSYQRPQIILTFVIITLSLASKNIEAVRDRGARCDNPDYIPNGSYRLRRDRVMRVSCNSGFQLQGPKTIDCIRGKWDGEKPVCAKKGCQKILEQPQNGRIQIDNDVKAILYCSDNYNLAGNRHSYCNGTHWDRPIGNCRERKNVIQHECDFETDDICGWTYEPREGLEWKRVMAANVFTSFKTGPRHDHTTLTANGGHYMLMESLMRQITPVTLTSPIYERALSLKTACCFQFYYFMYGAGVGDLFVVVKPVSLSLDEIFANHQDLIKFQKYSNQNNIWNEAHFNIEELAEDFQIAFVAKSGHGQLSDIAVDDVRLLTGDDCKILDKKPDEDVSNEEDNESTTYESMYEIQSCVGRCFDAAGSGLIRTAGHLKGLCNCDTDCEDNETCCPDFKIVCANELFAESSTILSNADEFTQENTQRNSNTSSTQTTTITTIKTTSTTPKPTTITIKTTPTKTKTTPTTVKTTKTTPTTLKTTQTTLKTTPTTIKTTPTTLKTTPTTIKTSTTTMKTTPTTQKTTVVKTTKTTPKTTRKATTTTTRKTTIKTTPTTIATTTSSTTTTTTTKKTTTPFTTTQATTTAAATPQVVPSTKKPIPIPKSTEYIINGKSNTEVAHKGSSLLLYTFVVIVIIILVGAVYRRFGESAVAWYLIHFKKNNSGEEDTSSIATSFKRPQGNDSETDKNPKTKVFKKAKKSTCTKNSMKRPLVDDDDDDDDEDIGINGNIALKNNIYTEL